ncbi:Probable spore germination protein gerPE [Chlamydia abortus]|nr:Probable spore germination protein gerPE [Chlamydia abortus]
MKRARISMVGFMKVNLIKFSSIIQIGDSLCLTPEAKVLAVQRSQSSYYGDEGDFNYPIFTNPIPSPLSEEEVEMQIIDESPYIKVEAIRILGLSVAAIVQIGSNHCIDAESRIKHIRQIVRDDLSLQMGAAAVQAVEAAAAGSGAAIGNGRMGR